MERIALNNDWYFTREWRDGLENLSRADATLEAVRLPHTVSTLPFNNFDPSVCQTVSGYLRFFSIPADLRGRRIFVCFEGAAHQAEVFCNGKLLGKHRCGYTAFRFELTDCIRFGEMNTLCVRLDSREREVPPFGGVIDYLTYGGLYREVRLEICETNRITDVFMRAHADGSFRCSIQTENPSGTRLKLNIRDKDGTVLYSAGSAAAEACDLSGTVPGIKPWSCDTPELYHAEVTLLSGDAVADSEDFRFGFRDAEFRKDGFYLNGIRTQLRGLDRHQSWAYLGYAAPARPQRLDADILKYELGCNAVRTSHYPQSRHFIDRCDEIGLLVFTEIPGWQHIGDEGWKAQAVENTREMVLQYRNHPSIILWGVRINESPDDDAFYEETNRVAHELDDTRGTGGVRNFRMSHFFEDVYTYNDFVHSGGNEGCEPKAAITPNPERAYMVTEYCGHMFPTKPFDDEIHRIRHAMRHARVVNDVMAHPDIAGSFGWCMFDYNTHSEFGSGDNICWHGVMDMFRNPKLAAALYASQSDDHPVLEVSGTLDIGECPACQLESFVAFSNADELRFYRNGEFITSFAPSADFAALPHPPFIVDDFFGNLPETREGIPSGLVPEVKQVCLALYSGHLSEEDRLRKEKLNASGITDARLNLLVSRYLTYWSDEGIYERRLDAVKDGKVICSRVLTPSRTPHLNVTADTTELCEDGCWDMASVRIRVLDANGNLQPYCSRALRLQLSGAAELIGPDCVPLIGGAAGCYIRTKGCAGSAALTVSAEGMDPVTLSFTIAVKES